MPPIQINRNLAQALYERNLFSKKQLQEVQQGRKYYFKGNLMQPSGGVTIYRDSPTSTPLGGGPLPQADRPGIARAKRIISYQQSTKKAPYREPPTSPSRITRTSGQPTYYDTTRQYQPAPTKQKVTTYEVMPHTSTQKGYLKKVRESPFTITPKQPKKQVTTQERPTTHSQPPKTQENLITGSSSYGIFADLYKTKKGPETYEEKKAIEKARTTRMYQSLGFAPLTARHLSEEQSQVEFKKFAESVGFTQLASLKKKRETHFQKSKDYFSMGEYTKSAKEQLAGTGTRAREIAQGLLTQYKMATYPITTKKGDVISWLQQPHPFKETDTTYFIGPSYDKRKRTVSASEYEERVRDITSMTSTERSEPFLRTVAIGGGFVLAEPIVRPVIVGVAGKYGALAIESGGMGAWAGIESYLGGESKQTIASDILLGVSTVASVEFAGEIVHKGSTVIATRKGGGIPKTGTLRDLHGNIRGPTPRRYKHTWGGMVDTWARQPGKIETGLLKMREVTHAKITQAKNILSYPIHKAKATRAYDYFSRSNIKVTVPKPGKTKGFLTGGGRARAPILEITIGKPAPKETGVYYPYIRETAITTAGGRRLASVRKYTYNKKPPQHPFKEHIFRGFDYSPSLLAKEYATKLVSKAKTKLKEGPLINIEIGTGTGERRLDYTIKDITILRARQYYSMKKPRLKKGKSRVSPEVEIVSPLTTTETGLPKTKDTFYYYPRWKEDLLPYKPVIQGPKTKKAIGFDFEIEKVFTDKGWKIWERKTGKSLFEVKYKDKSVEYYANLIAREKKAIQGKKASKAAPTKKIFKEIKTETGQVLLLESPETIKETKITQKTPGKTRKKIDLKELYEQPKTKRAKTMTAELKPPELISLTKPRIKTKIMRGRYNLAGAGLWPVQKSHRLGKLMPRIDLAFKQKSKTKQRQKQEQEQINDLIFSQKQLPKQKITPTQKIALATTGALALGFGFGTKIKETGRPPGLFGEKPSGPLGGTQKDLFGYKFEKRWRVPDIFAEPKTKRKKKRGFDWI